MRKKRMESITEKARGMISDRLEKERESVGEQAQKTVDALIAQLESGDFYPLSQRAVVTCTMQCIRYQKGDLPEIYKYTITETLQQKGIKLNDFTWQDSIGNSLILVVILEV